ncbi:translationally-controlled tumor protein homolog [Mizuhopecten yessoensis]|uniref:translationally-controlled tumor protein homolog n=1 Tax=Mizuhopecten yessoensis TaxID=6573 RepID=UPI000B4578C8|nr:translationally-controlled tumor protein homolog [Mizuhopecten yessoensis]
MIIYKDILTDQEMVSDAYPMSEDKPVRGMMTFNCRMVKEDGVGDYDIGANASQEEEAEQLQEAEQQMVVDIVSGFKLVETPMAKKDFKNFIKGEIKDMLKKIKEDMAENNVPEDKIKDKEDAFQKDAMSMAKWILERYDDVQLMIGSDYKTECMPGFLINKGADDIHMYYFKHALVQEKC